MDLELAKEQIKKLIEQEKFYKVDIVLNFLLHCIPFGELEELTKYAVELKKSK